jgi:hypothetical protein
MFKYPVQNLLRPVRTSFGTLKEGTPVRVIGEDGQQAGTIAILTPWGTKYVVPADSVSMDQQPNLFGQEASNS